MAQMANLISAPSSRDTGVSPCYSRLWRHNIYEEECVDSLHKWKFECTSATNNELSNYGTTLQFHLMLTQDPGYHPPGAPRGDFRTRSFRLTSFAGSNKRIKGLCMD